MRMPVVLRRWAYVGALVGAGVSIAANVLHSYVPPDGMSADWRPATGAVIGAIFWPVALLIAIEIFARWHPTELRFMALRWLGLVPVAVVAAVVSYRHMAGLLEFWHEDRVTVVIGPLAVDGIMTMAAGALAATNAEHANMPPTDMPPPVSLVKDPAAVLANTLARMQAAASELAAATPPPVPVVRVSLVKDPVARMERLLTRVETRQRAATPRAVRPRPSATEDATLMPRQPPPDGHPPAVARLAIHRAQHPNATQRETSAAIDMPMRTVARYWSLASPPANGRVPHAT